MTEYRKFMPPAPPTSALLRERLIKMIRGHFRTGSWVAMCAPGGSGKTVAAIQSLAECQGNCAWLAVLRPETDADVFYGRFYVAAAYARGNAATSPRPMKLDNALQALRALPRGRLKSRLVIDGTHMLEHEALCALPLLLESLPDSVSPLLLSRKVLPTVFDAAITEKRLVVLDGAALAFTPQEITELFADAGHEIDTHELQRVMRRTGGWAVALRAELTSALSEDATGTKSPQTAEDLYRFIDANLWPAWDKDARRLLLTCASAGILTPALCRRLTGEQTAGETLRHLASEGLVYAQPGRNGYFICGLLRGYLLKKREQLVADDEVASLRQSLGNWLEEQKDYHAALREYAAARDLDGMCRCLDSVHRDPATLPPGAATPFDYGHIIRKLPDLLVFESPDLLIARVWSSYMEGHVEDFLHWLDAMKKRLPGLAQDHPERAETFSLLSGLDFRTAIPTVAAHVRRSPVPPPKGRLPKTVRAGHMTPSMPLFHRGVRDYSEYHALHKADLELLRTTFGKMIGPEYTFMERCLMGGVLYEQGDQLQAAQHAFTARGALQDETSAETFLMVQMLLASVLLAMGARQQARRVYEEADARLRHTGAEYPQANLRAVAIRVRVGRGDLSAARDWLARSSTDSAAPLYFSQMARHFTTLSAHITLRNWQAADRFGKRLLRLTQAYRRPLDELETLTLLAVNACRAQQEKIAVNYFRCAINTAVPYSYTRILTDNRADLYLIAKTLAVDKKLADSKSDVFLAELLGDWESRQAPMPTNPKPTKLSPQQQRIMKGLMEGLNYEDIARRLNIAKGSVKTQVIRMYRTLDVHNAQDAILRTRALGLLNPH